MRIVASGSIGIGTVTPDASALLDLTSTTLGLLPPRVSTTQRDAISSPAAGLTIFNTTTSALNIYTGSAWASLAAASAAGSSGYVQFNSSSAFAADSALYWDNTNKYLGIGTTSPTDALEILGGGLLITSNTNARVKLLTAVNSGSHALFYGQRSGGTLAAKTATPANQILVQLFGEGYDGSAFGGSGSIGIYSSEAFTSTAKGTHIRFSTTATGSTTISEQMRILASGNVGIGTTSPGEKLDVSGNIKVAGTLQASDTAATCSVPADKGKFRYNSTTGKFQICR